MHDLTEYVLLTDWLADWLIRLPAASIYLAAVLAMSDKFQRNI